MQINPDMPAKVQRNWIKSTKSNHKFWPKHTNEQKKVRKLNKRLQETINIESTQHIYYSVQLEVEISN